MLPLFTRPAALLCSPCSPLCGGCWVVAVQALRWFVGVAQRADQRQLFATSEFKRW